MITNDEIRKVYNQIFCGVNTKHVQIRFDAFAAGFRAGLCRACLLVPEEHAVKIREAAGEQ